MRGELQTIGRNGGRARAAALSARRERHARPSKMLRDCLLSLLEATPGLVMAASSEGKLLYLNATGRVLLGVRQGDNLAAHALVDFYPASAYELLRDEAVPTCLETGVWRGETTLLGCDGEEIPAAQVLMAHRVEEGGAEMTVLSSIAWDMREHKSMERRLRRQATHDALTDCPNRGLLMDRLAQALGSAERHRRLVGVLFLDLDAFKQINDTLGHEPANILLRDFSQRLRARLRVEDTLARYGGDEFVMVVPELGTPSDVEYVIRKVNQALGEPFVVAGKNIRLSASVGVAVYPHDGENAEMLLRKADSRMYRNKKRTKTRAGLPAPPALPESFATLARDGGNVVVRTSL